VAHFATQHPIRSCLIAALIIGLLPLEAAAADSWMKLRRKGVKAVLEASKKAASAEPWRATWRIDGAKAGALKGLQVSLRVARVAADKSKPERLATVIKLSGMPALAGVGVATVGDEVWLRSPGTAKPLRATAKALFQPLPGVDVPPGLLAVAGLAGHYDGSLAGEFGGSAVIVLQPRYTGGKGWARMKIGISKRTLMPTMGEYNDRNGKALGRWLWLQTRMKGELMVAGRLRIRTMKREKPIDLELVSLERGPAIGRLPVALKALE